MLPPWCPFSCQSWVPILVRHYINLVSTVLAPVIVHVLTLCPFLCACHPVNLVSPFFVPAIMSTLCPLSWRQLSSQPCVTCHGARHHVHLVSPVLVPAIMSILFPLSWCPPSCPSCLPCLSARHHVQLVSTLCPPFWLPP